MVEPHPALLKKFATTFPEVSPEILKFFLVESNNHYAVAIPAIKQLIRKFKESEVAIVSVLAVRLKNEFPQKPISIICETLMTVHNHYGLAVDASLGGALERTILLAPCVFKDQDMTIEE